MSDDVDQARSQTVTYPAHIPISRLNDDAFVAAVARGAATTVRAATMGHTLGEPEWADEWVRFEPAVDDDGIEVADQGDWVVCVEADASAVRRTFEWPLDPPPPPDSIDLPDDLEAAIAARFGLVLDDTPAGRPPVRLWFRRQDGPNGQELLLVGGVGAVQDLDGAPYDDVAWDDVKGNLRLTIR